MTDQPADLREQYAHAIRNRLRIRFGPTVLRLARAGRPIKLTMEEAEVAADAVLAVRDAARQAAKACRCKHPADEHSIYGCEDGCACEWMPKRSAARQAAGQTPTTEQPDTCGVCGSPFPVGHICLGPDEPAPVVGQPAEAQPADEEAHPPREGWRIELLDVDGWMSSGLVRPDRELVAQYLAGRRKQRPDATFRLVRETTTWAVEETP
ncbi:hypothetical protein AB0D99_32045 [Streptomyces sp. NPDC047971]|uniref:hypothetical protein n=1 Tax=Streptomyces sp. NPDC047971 TaxID=3154499 RepID=UPI0033E5BC3C